MFVQEPARKRTAGQAAFRFTMVALSLLLAVFVIWITAYGYAYYRRPVTTRFRSPLHAELKPGGLISHKLGIIGSCMLLGLLVYSVRKRSRRMQTWGKLSSWLNFHIYLGIAGPILITYHTAFKLRGIVAVSYWSMVVVAVSGMLGRYLYAQMTSAITDRELQYGEINKQLELVNARLAAALDAGHLALVNQVADFHATTSSLFGAGLMMLTDDIRWQIRKRRLQRILASTAMQADQRADLLRLARQRQLALRRLSLLRASQKLFRYWHIVHLPLAETMYITMAIHITVAIMTGYF